MQFIQLVNDVLVRLRETEVSSVSDNAYAKMIAKFVNDAKRQVEDAYPWNALADTLTATTTPGLFSYVLEGSQQRFRVIDVLNDTENYFLNNAATSYMDRLFLVNNSSPGKPIYYNFNGVNSNGDTLVDIYPIPDKVYDIRFNMILPQPLLVANADYLKVPYEPVVYLAYAKALAERGEDGGLAANEAYGLYRQSLADAISIESGRYAEEQQWEVI